MISRPKLELLKPYFLAQVIEIILAGHVTVSTCPIMSSVLDDDFWEDLLTLIEGGKVIPEIGAGVITQGKYRNGILV
jgi:hypothetical protein